MYRRKFTFLLLILGWISTLPAEAGGLTLDSCRNLAVRNNNELRMADMKHEAALWGHKSARMAYLPKISATGMYMHTGRELSLLSGEQKATLSSIGDALSMPALNQAGQGIVDALRTDTRNVAGAAVMLTQPVYMGGKIRAYDRITRYAGMIAEDKRNLQYQELIVEVEETYWNIVQLSARRELALKYLDLVNALDNDVAKMIAEGFATKSDGLSVKVKVNEAKVAMIQVDNGIELQKMHLCQLCGIPLDSVFTLADENRDDFLSDTIDMPDEDLSVDRRPELSALSTSLRIEEEKVRIARSGFLPSVVLTGGYFASTPSVFNSFEKKFKGTWNVGVAVNIPILTWGDRKYKVRAAEAEAAAARFGLEETREKIELQVDQCRRKVIEARERLDASMASQKEADENLRYASLGFREGVIPLINLLEAQTAWLSARTVLITSDVDLRLAYVYLNRATGTIK